MEQADDLNKLYDPLQHSVRGYSEEECMQKLLEFVDKESQLTLDNVPGRLGISYGDTDAQKVDFFGEDELPRDAPIFVYVHGGYWVIGSRPESRFFVRPLFKAGALCCVVGYDLAQESVLLPDIVAEIRKAIQFILDYANQRQSRGVYFSGQSAGAHLLAMALSSFTESIKYAHLIKDVILISGLYDLKKMWTTSHAERAFITENIANGCSPQTVTKNLEKNLNPSTQVHVVVAEYDSPAFREQSENYFQELQKTGIISNFDVINNEDHLTLAENLSSSDTVLTKKIIKIMDIKDEKASPRL